MENEIAKFWLLFSVGVTDFSLKRRDLGDQLEY